MSKGNSHLFHGTSGANQELIEKVIAKGYKITPEKVVIITQIENGNIVWLETGSDSSGLQHIIKEHGKEFNGKGIANDEIPNYILEAVCQGNVVGYQGKRNPRTIYEFTYHGTKQKIAIQISTNGYIVGANPRSNKE